MPPRGEPELIDRAIPTASRVLELGCGTGRLANPLAARGHRVVGVDESAAMLAYLDGVTPVHARIEQLRLDETFDVVLLAANMIGTESLEACARHVAPGGQVIVQWLPPSWFDGPAVREGWLGPVHGRTELRGATAETVYTLGGRSWVQRFEVCRRTEEQLDRLLHDSGLRRDRWLDDAGHWFAALPM
nr:class I SAM-dependent methyltransferase [Catenuloplanes japonicus]